MRGVPRRLYLTQMIAYQQPERQPFTIETQHKPNKYRVEYIQVVQQGDLLKVRRPKRFPTLHHTEPPVPGVITKFSAKSRKRMLELFASFDRDKIKFSKMRMKFVTATYPENMTDHAKAKRDKKAFLERVQERFPDAWIVGRKEEQERGALHWHFIMGEVPYIPFQELQRMWNEVAGHDAKNSLDIQVISSMNGVMRYVSKYIAKIEETPEIESHGDYVYPDNRTDDQKEREKRVTAQAEDMGLSVCQTVSQPKSTGRWWTIYGRKNLPLAERTVIEAAVTLETLYEWVDHLNNRYASPFEGFTIFSPRAASAFRQLKLVMLDHQANNSAARWVWEQGRKAYRELIHNELIRLQDGMQERLQEYYLDELYFALENEPF